MKSSPRRLLEDPGVSALERAVLDAGRRSPIDYDVDAGLERFRTNLAALAAAGATTAVATAAKGASGALSQGALLGKLGAKLLLVVAVPAAGVAAALHYAEPARESAAIVPLPSAPAAQPVVKTQRPLEVKLPVVATEPTPAAPPPVSGPALPAARAAAPAPAAPRIVRPEAIELEEEPAAPVVPEPAPESVEAERGEVEPEPAPARQAAPKPTSVSRSAPREPRAASSQAMDEMRALARARSLVGSNPGAAVTALDAIGRAHPRGYFVEERRALTVLALARAGNRAAARAQGAAFLKAYPKSPFADRVRAAAGL